MKLYDLLGTKSRKEQEKRVEQLLNSPVLELVVRYDTRFDVVVVQNLFGEMPLDVGYMMLERARQFLQNQERRALDQMQQQTLPPVEENTEGED